MKQTNIDIILPAVISNIESYNNTENKDMKYVLRYGLRRMIQYWSEVEEHSISEAAYKICQERGIDWTKLKKNVKGDVVGKPAVLGDHTKPLMSFIYQLYEVDTKYIRLLLLMYPPICWITRDENNVLNRNKYKNKRPGGWKKCYSECGIIVRPAVSLTQQT